MNRDIKIGFLTATDPEDKRSWSGIHHFMYKTLQKHFSHVNAIGPLDGGWPQINGRVKSFLLQKIFGKKFDHTHSKALSLHYAREVEKKIKETTPDLLFAPTASTMIANLKTTIPIISLSDATVELMIDYYPAYSNLIRSSREQALEIERKAIEKSTFCLYPSAWAAKSAINFFGASSEKVLEIPFGANLNFIPERAEINFDKKLEPLKILFLGVEWERKGGPLVLETMQKLAARNIQTELTIVGCEPDISTNFPTTIIPFIDKNNPEGEKRIAQLFNETNYLFVPSKAECYGIVFCEAAAFGVPSLAFDTGGLGGAVIDGKNGMKAIRHSPEEFVIFLEDQLRNPQKYHVLCKSSRDLYESTHNWKHWLNSVIPLIEKSVRIQK